MVLNIFNLVKDFNVLKIFLYLINMFKNLFKSDPLKKLKKEYKTLLEKGVFYQRNGKIKEFAEISAKAENIYKEIERLENEKIKEQ